MSSSRSSVSAPSSSISAARQRSRSPTAFEGSDTLFKTGKTEREVAHSIVALARWAGSGRGASCRFSGRKLSAHGLVTWPKISQALRAARGPPLHRLRQCQIGTQRGDVTLPQRQVAAGKILGGGHRAEYIAGCWLRKRPSCGRRVFDAALPLIRCIVAEGTTLEARNRAHEHPEQRYGKRRETGGRQKVCQPPSLQYGDEHLRNPRGSRKDDQGWR